MKEGKIIRNGPPTPQTALKTEAAEVAAPVE
jgi:hypothetical protein